MESRLRCRRPGPPAKSRVALVARGGTHDGTGNWAAYGVGVQANPVSRQLDQMERHQRHRLHGKQCQKLIVVVETATGIMTTYYFIVGKDLDVWVVDNVVHIPALCIKSVPGNAIKCR